MADPPRPRLTLVLCARNDRYQGDAVGRLQTALNFLGVSAREAGVENALEVLVADWGSAVPLRLVLALEPTAAALTRFCEISPEWALEHTGDSPFPEVRALNAVIRRAEGEFIGRIDQDTLVTTEFLRRFFAETESSEGASVPWGSGGYFFLKRSSIPYGVARRMPGADWLRRFIDRWGAWLPLDGPQVIPWFDAPVGVLILHRERWAAARGYDERLIYWGWMETDLGFRLFDEVTRYDLSDSGWRPLFHQEHVRWRLPWGGRRKNPRIETPSSTVNSEGWGMADTELPLRRAEPVVAKVSVVPNGEAGLFFAGLIGVLEIWAKHILLRGVKQVRLLRRLQSKWSVRNQSQ